MKSLFFKSSNLPVLPSIVDQILDPILLRLRVRWSRIFFTCQIIALWLVGHVASESLKDLHLHKKALDSSYEKLDVPITFLADATDR